MPTILVVEDDIPTNELLCRLLARFGYQSCSAFNGEAGLAMVQTMKPDLVILDQMMPGMNGLEVLTVLRSQPDTAMIPVVIYSANADHRFAETARLQGAADVWLKGRVEPIKIPSLIEQLLSSST